jgi:predicted HTH transcriptional regulator
MKEPKESEWDNKPVDFSHTAYIRVGSITRKLADFPEKERKIWRKSGKPYELEIAKDSLSAADVVRLLSTESYFDLMKLPYPSNQNGVIEKFINENLVIKSQGYAITNLGAILFAKNLAEFESVQRKSVRIIVYKGKNKVETIREQIGIKALEEKIIKEDDPENKSRKYASYVPYWA